MPKKFKIFSILFSLITSFFIFSNGPMVHAAAEEKGDSQMETLITNEVESLVNRGELPSWHLNYLNESDIKPFITR